MPAPDDDEQQQDEQDESRETKRGKKAGAASAGRGRTPTHAETVEEYAEEVSRQNVQEAEQRAAAEVAELQALAGPLRSPAKGFKNPPGQTQISTLLRRQQVLYLWTRSYTLSEIAQTLQADPKTVRNDITELQKDLQRDLLPELHTRVNRAVSIRQSVQAEAWALYHRLEDKSHNKVAALTVILQAADAEDKMTGVAAPEQVNATVVAEMQSTVMEALYAVGGERLQQEFLRRLRAQSTTARDFYPPDPQMPGERRELDDFLPPPAGFVDAGGE